MFDSNFAERLLKSKLHRFYQTSMCKVKSELWFRNCCNRFWKKSSREWNLHRKTSYECCWSLCLLHNLVKLQSKNFPRNSNGNKYEWINNL